LADLDQVVRLSEWLFVPDEECFERLLGELLRVKDDVGQQRGAAR
jgi:hypothetical protein